MVGASPDSVRAEGPLSTGGVPRRSHLLAPRWLFLMKHHDAFVGTLPLSSHHSATAASWARTGCGSQVRGRSYGTKGDSPFISPELFSQLNSKRSNVNTQDGLKVPPGAFLLLLWTGSPLPPVARAHSGRAVSKALRASLCSLRRQAWDLAVDICLSQLPTIIEEGTAFRVSPARASVWSTGVAPRALGGQVSFTRLGSSAVSGGLEDRTHQGLGTLRWQSP